jgi:hypothetical protein
MPQHWLATLTTPPWAHHAARLLHTCALWEASQLTAGWPAPPAGLPHTHVSTQPPGQPPTAHHRQTQHTAPHTTRSYLYATQAWPRGHCPARQLPCHKPPRPPGQPTAVPSHTHSPAPPQPPHFLPLVSAARLSRSRAALATSRAVGEGLAAMMCAGSSAATSGWKRAVVLRT